MESNRQRLMDYVRTIYPNKTYLITLIETKEDDKVKDWQATLIGHDLYLRDLIENLKHDTDELSTRTK